VVDSFWLQDFPLVIENWIRRLLLLLPSWQKFARRQLRALLLQVLGSTAYIGTKQRPTQGSCESMPTMEETCWSDPLFEISDDMLQTPSNKEADDDLDIFAILEEAAEALQHLSEEEILREDEVGCL